MAFIERGPRWRVPGQRQDEAAPKPSPAAGAKPVSLAVEQRQRLRLARGLSGEERNVGGERGRGAQNFQQIELEFSNSPFPATAKNTAILLPTTFLSS